MWHVSVFRIPVRLSGRNYLICFWSSVWVLKMKLVRFLSSFVNDHLPFNLSHHQIHKGVNVHPRVMVNGKDRGEEFSQVVWVLSVRRVMVFPVKSEVENGLCIYRHPADWPFALKPPTGYPLKRHCPVLKVAPGPNWVPCGALNGDMKLSACTPGINIETSNRSP